MLIKFLGTSAAWPLPRLGKHKDKICSSTNPKDTRTRAQALVDGKILLDAGPDTYLHLKNEASQNISLTLITHFHPDHTQGLWDLSHIYQGKKMKLLLHPKTLDKLSSLRPLLLSDDFEIVKLEFNQEFDFENYKITFLEVNHTEGAGGYLIEKEGKRFFYAPDFKSLPKETIKKLKHIDLIMMDGSELKTKTPTHQTIKEGISLAKQIEAKKAYFTHLGHRTLPYEELLKYVKKEGDNFEIPYDGQEISL